MAKKQEWKNEELFKELLEEKGYKNNSDIKIERQDSDIPMIDKYLKQASKNNTNFAGRLDFIISKAGSKVIILVECKSDNTDHLKACQEVQHYANYVSRGFEVIAIATSGKTKQTLKISVFTWNKNDNKYGTTSIIDDIRTFEEFEDLILMTPERKAIEIGKLKNLAEELNNDIRSMIPDLSNSNDIMLLLSGILLALEDEDFKREYINYSYDKIADKLIIAIEDTFKRHKIQEEKRKILMHSYNGLVLSNVLKQKNEDINDNPLKYIINKIVEIVIPIKDNMPNIDILANFYSEIIRYTVGDGKGGFVLTPSHITELFTELADLTTDTKILDICTGTGGFLISAMSNELKKANGDKLLEKKIKEKNFYGVEVDKNRYTFACTNMILRGDGQSNIYNDDCFKIKESLKNIKAKVGFMNPPYSSDKGYKGPSELEFVEYLLDCLDEKGIAIIIVPKSCAKEVNTSALIVRERIFSKHTLEAVMSMPESLFGRDAGADTCIMVFRAKQKHTPDKKVWLANWVDDGYVVKRNKGRVDENNRFEKEILPYWVGMFKNKDVIDKISMKKALTVNDEWLYASHVDLSYQDLNDSLFAKRVKDLALFVLSNEEKFKDFNNDFEYTNEVLINPDNWKEFKLVGKGGLFEIEKVANNLVTNDAQETGNVCFISAAVKNNGCIGYVDSPSVYKGNCLTLANAGQASVGLCNYQPFDFVSISTVHVLRPLFECNVYRGIFIATVLQLIREFRSFGQGITKRTLSNLKIKLPVDDNGNPNLVYMENYIKSLPYSSAL